MNEEESKKPDTTKMPASVALVESLKRNIDKTMDSHYEGISFLFKKVNQLESDNFALQSLLYLITSVIACSDAALKENITIGITTTISELIPENDPYNLKSHLETLLNVVNEDDPTPKSRTERILKIVRTPVSSDF
jgi:hypothetical protein